MIVYKNGGKEAYFDGVKFTRDDNTGYYLNSTIGKRLHRYVWEYWNGDIPVGYHIHHIDENKANNNINNLQLIAHRKHIKKHGKYRAIEDTEWFVNFHAKGIEKAKEWHKSEEGSEWHKEHYENVKDKLHEKMEFSCEQCKMDFIGTDNGVNRFCSNKCKSAWRRASGIDDEERICEQCGEKYTVNKYRKNRTCSKACSNKLFPRLPQLNKRTK